MPLGHCNLVLRQCPDESQRRCCLLLPVVHWSQRQLLPRLRVTCKSLRSVLLLASDRAALHCWPLWHLLGLFLHLSDRSLVHTYRAAANNKDRGIRFNKTLVKPPVLLLSVTNNALVPG